MSAWFMGYNAYYLGVTFNPFRNNRNAYSKAYSEWAEGWWAGRDEYASQLKPGESA